MKLKVIILKTQKWRESDLILRCITPSGAKISFIAKGALKSKKRFGGGILEPTHYISIIYKESKNSDDGDPLHLLQEAELIRGFEKLRTQYDRLEVALQTLNLIEKVAQPSDHQSQELFDLLGNTLSAAETTVQPEVLKVHFKLKLVYTLGVLSQFENYADWLKFSIRHHEQITVSRQNLQQMDRDLNRIIERYHRGLDPNSTY